MKHIALTLAFGLLATCVVAEEKIAVPPQLLPYFQQMRSATLADIQMLTLYNETPVKQLDPPFVMTAAEQRILRGLFEGLVIHDPRTLEPCPGMAAHWEVSADRCQYTFFLRPACWSNGTPVKASDFVFAWERLLNPTTKSDLHFLLFHLKNGRQYHQGRWQHLCQPTKLYPQPGSGQGQDLAADMVLEILPSSSPQSEWLQVRTPDGHQGWIRACANLQIDQQAFSRVGVKARDDRTLVITLQAPAPYFLSLCASTALVPLPAEHLRKWGAQAFSPEKFVGNGPYLLSKMTAQEIVLQKNPRYWLAPLVKLEKVVALNIKDLNEAFERYLDDEIDWMTNVPANQMTDYIFRRTDFSLTPFFGTSFYRFNVKRPPFDDVRVRRALALAVDKRYICWFLLGNGVIPATSFIPPGLPGYQPIDGLHYNPAQARELLAAAGYPQGRGFPEIQLLGDNILGKYIADMWRRHLGIRCKLQKAPWQEFLQRLKSLRYQVAYSGWLGDYLDPSTFIEMFSSSDPNNETGWSCARYDQLVQQARNAKDPDRHMSYLRQAEIILVAEEAPIIPLFYHVTKMLIHPRVKGVYPNIYRNHPFQFIYLVRE